MMSGTFIIGERRVRPGTYFNIQNPEGNTKTDIINGIVGVLFRSDWGEIGQVIELTAADEYEKLCGTKLTADAIKYAFEGGAKTVLACRVGSGGTASSVKLKTSENTDAITITAKYAGEKEFSVSIKDKLSDNTKKECIIYSGTKEYEKKEFLKGGDEISALLDAFSNSKYFIAVKENSVTGEIAAISQIAFTKGVNPAATTEDYSNAFSLLEMYQVNTICVDTEDVAIHSLLMEYLNRIYEVGQLAMGVVAEKETVDLEERMTYAVNFNSEKMIYLLNSAVTNNGIEIQGYQTAAKIAGMVAACPSNKSLTHTIITGMTQIKDRLTSTQIIKAETMGCLVLSENPSKQIWIDNAINTLVTLPENQDEGWKKIRRTKTRYELITRCNQKSDELVGKVDNDTNGRATIISQLQIIGTNMIEENKLTSFAIKESEIYQANGDSVWFEVDCIDKDSAEHIYLTYNFRFSTQEV